MPSANPDPLDGEHYQASPGLPEREAGHPRLIDTDAIHKAAHIHWGNAKAPSSAEMAWIRSFGRYPHFNPSRGRLSKRLSLEIADLGQATRIIVYYHYLHRGRTMAQLGYWIVVDRIPVGVLLFSLPRLSVPLDGIGPMNVLELARIWVSPDVQDRTVVDGNGKAHSLSVASCAIGSALRVVAGDWKTKYPQLPDVMAVVSWADDEHHEGTIYRAANFRETGKSGGSMHGNRRRPNGGRDQWNVDYAHVKTRFLYVLDGKQAATRSTDVSLSNRGQGALFTEEDAS